MGAALLMLQGVAACAWLFWRYGRRAALAVALTLLLAWIVEHLGETTGWPFGRYRYSDVLMPQIGGVVPVPIVCAWLMVALGAWQLACMLAPRTRSGAGRIGLMATLVLVLDLQIETVATGVNGYWIWLEHGPYYGVPTANFVAWWIVGALMAALLNHLLPEVDRRTEPGLAGRNWLARRAQLHIPALLYTLSTLMFMLVNFSYGYGSAGLLGLAVLALLAWRIFMRGRRWTFLATRPAADRTSD